VVPRRKITCGLCGQEGHNRTYLRECPQLYTKSAKGTNPRCPSKIAVIAPSLEHAASVDENAVPANAGSITPQTTHQLSGISPIPLGVRTNSSIVLQPPPQEPSREPSSESLTRHIPFGPQTSSLSVSSMPPLTLPISCVSSFNSLVSEWLPFSPLPSESPLPAIPPS
jgi:hypothetical protein